MGNPKELDDIDIDNTPDVDPPQETYDKDARLAPALPKKDICELKRILRGGKNSRGYNMLKRYADGFRLTARQAIVAKCCDCMGHYVDGLHDCDTGTCPLYPYMPYGTYRKNYIRPDRIEVSPLPN